MNATAALSQLRGVFAMAFNRPGWERALDRSLDGVFGSFWAIAWSAPLLLANFAGMKALFSAAGDGVDDRLLEAPMTFWLGSNFATFLADWAVGLAAILAAARFLGVSKRAGDVVIGYNWLQFLWAAAQAIPIGAGLLAASPSTFSLLMMPAIALSLAVFWGILRRGLGLAPGLAIALAAASMLLSVIVGAACHAVALALYGASQ
jgi:hypothetical protein